MNHVFFSSAWIEGWERRGNKMTPCCGSDSSVTCLHGPLLKTNRRRTAVSEWWQHCRPTDTRDFRPSMPHKSKKDKVGTRFWHSRTILDLLCDSLCDAYALLILTGSLQIWKIKKIWGEKWACRRPRCKYLWMRHIDMDESLCDTFKQCTTYSLHHGV